MQGRTGVAALPLDVPGRFAAAIGNGLLSLAAAVVDAGLQFKGIPHRLNFIGMSGVELENSVVFLSNLPIEACGENSRFGSALALRQLRADILSGGNGTAEPFAHGRVEIGGLDELVTADGVDVRAHGGQGIHDELVALVVAAVASAASAVVPAVAVPGTAHGSADDAADERAAPVSPAVIVAVDVESRLQSVHDITSKKFSAPAALFEGQHGAVRGGRTDARMHDAGTCRIMPNGTRSTLSSHPAILSYTRYDSRWGWRSAGPCRPRATACGRAASWPAMIRKCPDTAPPLLG